MSVTPITRNPVRVDHRLGNRITYGQLDFPFPDGALDLIPEPVLAARATVLKLNTSESKAIGDVYLASEAIKAGEATDTSALAQAISKGTDDPGPIHADAARAAKRDADRQLAGTTEALRIAREAYWHAVYAIDWAPIAVALEQKAVDHLEQIPSLLAAVAGHRKSAAEIRGLALRLEAFPNGSTGLTRWDEQDFRRSIKTIEDGTADIMYPPLMATQPVPVPVDDTEAEIGGDAA